MNDMILLMDNYGNDSKSLHTSFRMAGIDCPTLVIDDDGFLPEDVTSVFGFFLGDFTNASNVPGRPRYFNEVVVPDYWEISGTNNNGKIHDLTRERGRIFYAEPTHRRLVKIVDWLDERGIARVSDHYNRYGAIFAKTIFNEKGQRVNKAYFDADGREIIVENFVTGDIILNEGNGVKFFRNRVEFIAYLLTREPFQGKRICFNTLSTSFFVTQRIPAEATKGDILFWQESERGDIPGNMQVILNGQANRAATIYVQKRQAYDRLLALGANPAVLHSKGFVYPFARENEHRREVLICTNSDNVEHCEELIKALPELHFHIAALTEMSSKLMGKGVYENVSLYPGVKPKVLDSLFAKCDWYFDINHGNEIVSATQQAFLNNQLILAFSETIHGRNYITDENIYPAAECDRMIADVKKLLADSTGFEKLLGRQREAAYSEDVGAYLNL